MACACSLQEAFLFVDSQWESNRCRIWTACCLVQARELHPNILEVSLGTCVWLRHGIREISSLYSENIRSSVVCTITLCSSFSLCLLLTQICDFLVVEEGLRWSWADNMQGGIWDAVVDAGCGNCWTMWAGRCCACRLCWSGVRVAQRGWLGRAWWGAHLALAVLSCCKNPGFRCCVCVSNRFGRGLVRGSTKGCPSTSCLWRAAANVGRCTRSLGKASQLCRTQRVLGAADPSPGPGEKVGCLLCAQGAGGEEGRRTWLLLLLAGFSWQGRCSVIGKG